MSHEEFARLLGEVAPGAPWRDALPPAARDHVDRCSACRLLAAGLFEPSDQAATVDDPPEDYWAAFESRLARRLADHAPAVPARRRRWWPAAAALAAAAAWAAATLWMGGSPGGGPTLVAGPADGWESLSSSDLAALDDLAGSSASAWEVEGPLAPDDDEARDLLPPATGWTAGPEAVHVELAETLTGEEASELAVLLREEMTS